MPEQQQATIALKDNSQFNCMGNWTMEGIVVLTRQLPHLHYPTAKEVTITGDKVSAMDSTGAWVLLQIIKRLREKGQNIVLSHFRSEHESLLELVKKESKKIKQIPRPARHNWIYKVGKGVVNRYRYTQHFLAFLGETLVALARVLRNPSQIQFRAFLNIIDETGYRALPIVGLLCGLIGIVLAYQMGQQLTYYGANIYIVSLMGVGVLQEFAPLITAIIVAGRTSSSFTAQIGTMKINEEIDALKTLGLSPINWLVLPKMFGLMAAMPLLVVWADIFGIFGGMIVANHMLHISFQSFLLRIPVVVELRTFLYGLLKAPVFAAIIATVGCYQGFQVTYTADSVGKQTTRSVVHSIFLIIVADAIFSVILPWQMIQ